MREQTIWVFYDERSAASSQYANMLQGIRNAASRYGIRLQMAEEQTVGTMDFSRVDSAAILASANLDYIKTVIDMLRGHDLHPILAGIDSEQFSSEVSCATPSRRAETQQLVNYLYHCQRRRIALVGFGKHSINDNFRFHAAMSASAAWGNILTQEDVWLWEHDPGECFEDFLRVSHRYDAVICPNDMIAICFITFCKTHSLRVPEDLFVASFGNTVIGRLYQPSITTMTMDMIHVGELAFDIWRFIIQKEGLRKNALKIMVPSRILVRQSTADMPIQTFAAGMSNVLQKDNFYLNPTISAVVGIENCFSQRDALDMRIVRGLLNKDSYEQIASDTFISDSTLRYRLKKIYQDAGVESRRDFEALLKEHLGKDVSLSF